MPNVYIRTPRSNLVACLKHGLYGFVRRSEAAGIEVGDHFVLYNSRSRGSKKEYFVNAVVKVVSPALEDRSPIYPEGGLYPYRVKIEPIKLFEESQAPIIDETLRVGLRDAARSAFQDFSSPSWSNFQRFNRPLPPAFGQLLLDWLRGEPGTDDVTAIKMMVGELCEPVSPEKAVPIPAELPIVDDDVTSDGDIPSSQEEIRAHIRAQWLLARIAAKANLDVWIARNDHNATTPQGVPLRDLSLTEFPDLPLPPQAEKAARLIDVLWIDQARIPAAFEVEYSTGITKGLLRLSDLAFSMGSSIVRLCIVAPQERFEKVRAEIKRPSFGVAFDKSRERRCYFLSFESLEKLAKPIIDLPNSFRIQAPKLEEIAVDLLE